MTEEGDGTADGGVAGECRTTSVPDSTREEPHRGPRQRDAPVRVRESLAVGGFPSGKTRTGAKRPGGVGGESGIVRRVAIRFVIRMRVCGEAVHARSAQLCEYGPRRRVTFDDRVALKRHEFVPGPEDRLPRVGFGRGKAPASRIRRGDERTVFAHNASESGHRSASRRAASACRREASW